MSAALFHCCKSSLFYGSHGTRAVAHQVCADHYYACVDNAQACLLFAMMRLREYRCVRVCVLVCWNSTFRLFCFFLLLCLLLLLLPYHDVCITPSLKLSSPLLGGSHGTTAVAQRVCTTTYYACVVIAYACVLCVLYDTGACV